MKIVLMNMVKIYDEKNKKVLVLDKKKKYGWEGLTFPGGKVEEKESFENSVIREAKEETNLEIKNPKFVGIITWTFTNDKGEFQKDVGLLYQTNDFSGKLIENNREGKLFWKDYDEFKKMDKMSDSMPEILKIYDGKYREIYWDVDKDRKDYY
ncbi:NUDIX domain-containing protein [Anaerococcus vaginalis]|uniref:NUDIX domain-containing protein n=1 Tax=Anaerococcus vaginalis TaxID=33037 RepID=UPI00288C5A58|nr:NUDIX domain-containing protein [Anaerococcus vaginalis]MDU5824873.1 NUDIX domain-containing protein [Anaerococcus vaginalis]MDU7142134.1 NUDIX domain-containing protein [Anaerococcus vaginalis]